ncbi:MAG: Fic family protein [Proteobacteria bacterium]|nr:Fic family protein [Pseudomonadota bacterium]
MNEKIIAKKKILDRLLTNKNNRTVLYEWLRTELAYTSNAVEGNTLSRRETARAITENFTTGTKPIKDYIEARNHADAFAFILESIGRAPDKKLVLGIHERILSGIDNRNAGAYRDVPVRIAGSRVVMPNYARIPELMDDFFAWLKKPDRAAARRAMAAHLRLVSIHPFVDGNGRTARLLMNFMLMRAGFAPIIIRPLDRKRYLDAIEDFQLTGNSERYERFMTGALSRSLSMAINILDGGASNLRDMMTIAKFADLAGLPTSTIRYWVSIGKLKPAAYTESGYMLFARRQLREIETSRKSRSS